MVLRDGFGRSCFTYAHCTLIFWIPEEKQILPCFSRSERFLELTMTKLSAKAITPNRDYILIFLVFLSLQVNSFKAWECGRRQDNNLKDDKGQSASPWTVKIQRKVHNAKNDHYEWKYLQSGTLVGLQTVITCASERLSNLDNLYVETGLAPYFVQTVEPLRLQGFGVYLLNLNLPITPSNVSYPVCIDTSRQIFNDLPSVENVYISGRVLPDDQNLEPSVQILPLNKKRIIRDWDENGLILTNNLNNGNLERTPVFDTCSALVYNANVDGPWFLLGVNLVEDSSSTSLYVQSIETLTEMIHVKQQCASHQRCSNNSCQDVICNDEFFCICGGFAFRRYCTPKNIVMKATTCEKFGNSLPNDANHSTMLPQNHLTIVNNIQSTTLPNEVESTTPQNRPTIENEKGSTNWYEGFCQPIKVNSTQDIDISCWSPNGVPDIFNCIEDPVRIGSKAVLSCSIAWDIYTVKTCDGGVWITDSELDPNPENDFPLQCPEIKIQAQKEGLNQTKDIKCPRIQPFQGVQINCTFPGSESSQDCTKEDVLPGTKVQLKCKPFYVSQSTDSILEQSCDSRGNWVPKKSFGCSYDCGKAKMTDRLFIVNGSKTEPELWPWHVALFIINHEGSYGYFCGGTLISKSIVLTAGHCVYKKDESMVKVIIGAISSNYSDNENIKDDRIQTFDIREIKYHDYCPDGRNIENDIALIRLSKPVKFTEFVQPVCFPYPGEKSDLFERIKLSPGNYGYVVGFGTDENWKASSGELKGTRIPYVSVQECVNVLERWKPVKSEYCAGFTNGTSVCTGDSGSGMVFLDKNVPKRFHLLGIVSRGDAIDDVKSKRNKYCDNNKYAIFTKVVSFNEWVKKAVDVLEYDYQY